MNLRLFPKSLLFFLSVFALVLQSCSENESVIQARRIEINRSKNFEISGVDISSQVLIGKTNTVFYDSFGKAVSLLDFYKNNGVNTIRLRTWVGENNEYNLKEIAQFSNQVKTAGFLSWIDMHYSETWADPGNQAIPQNWKNLPLKTLIDSMVEYTKQVCEITKPDIIQVGNEINNGMVWPVGTIGDTSAFFKILRACTKQCRISAPNARILLHYAGVNNALAFFWWMRDHQVDYDIAGVSYYPKWHGHSLDSVFSVLGDIQFYLRKQPIIAETSYPFTLGWNDYTNNVMGSNADLLPGYPASPEGQYSFMRELVQRSRKLPFASGVCYWESNWVAYLGKTATNGSPWENQAWFDFSNKALPVNWIFKNP